MKEGRFQHRCGGGLEIALPESLTARARTILESVVP